MVSTSWEENTERRLGIVEQKVDKILDPQSGVYPKMEEVANKLRAWAIVILTTLVLNLIGVIVALALITRRNG